MNSNLFKRTCTCVLGVPALFALIYFLPMYNFIGITVLVAVLTLLGTIEMSKLVLKEVHYIAFLSWIYTIFPEDFSEYFLVFIIINCLCLSIKGGEKDNFKSSIDKCAKLVFICIYPAFFMRFLVRFFALSNVNAFVIFLYLVLVFSNDIFAYVFGMLFGKNNRGIFKVSPKKSVAGFIGGFLSCIGICFLYTFLLQNQLPRTYLFGEKLLIAILVSVLANMGDLIESVIKRSADVKDSGNLIPGRGGVLDCIDSICTTAPIIFFIFRDIVL